ncbi:DNA polymerase phi-domain-containing protein [Jimgerdemannia flammicorona]|uniref:DNA polymerase phi-domain-containing protein n=1 Tax=Jimgerdemannia flammicorona TaxID=994334 RepID=A0A433DDJ3_9FUNG|nr:DNA polymerase phi-domain-containing protein [Jimgerdemannia flammicorona]
MALPQLKELKHTPSKNDHESQYRAFELLFLHVVLQLFTEEKEATPVLSELQDCYDKVFTKKAVRTPKKKRGVPNIFGQDDEDVAGPTAEREYGGSRLFCGAASSVLFCFGLMLIVFCCHTQILETKESKVGQEELFEADDEEGDDVEEMDLDEEEEEDDEDDDDEDDDDDDEEVDEEFRAKLAEALNVQEGDDDDEELLGDEDMVQFDEKLAEIFRLKKMQKAEKKGGYGDKCCFLDAKENVVYFKNKILDLLDIFIRKNPENPLIFDMILPLLALLRTTSSTSATKQMVDKTTTLLNSKLAKIKDYPRLFDPVHLHDILEQIHEVAKRAPSNSTVILCSNLSLVLVKTLLGGHDDDDTKISSSLSKVQVHNSTARIVVLYKSSLADFMSKKSSRLQPSLFLNFITRFPRTAWALADSLVTYAGPTGGVKQYRRAQAYNMLSVLVQRAAAKRSDEFDREFEKTTPDIVEVVKETLAFSVSEGNADGKVLNTLRLKDVLKFAAVMLKMWKVDLFAPLLQLVAQDNKFQSPAIRTLCQQILDLLETGVKQGKAHTKLIDKANGKDAKTGVDDKKRKRVGKKENENGAERTNKKKKDENARAKAVA